MMAVLLLIFGLLTFIFGFVSLVKKKKSTLLTVLFFISFVAFLIIIWVGQDYQTNVTLEETPMPAKILEEK